MNFIFWRQYAHYGLGELADCDSMLGNMLAREEGVIPGNKEGGIPKGRGNNGIEEIRIRSISDSCSLFVLARRFWNQIFT